jgi:hypothetical protein
VSIDHFLDILSGCYQSPESVAFLLRRGANVHARDELGDTCLHIVLKKLHRMETLGSLDVLVLLIRNGADTHAENFIGQTVADIADERNSLCSSPGDVWDRALHATGNNILEHRKGRLRTARYDYGYERHHFERLWRGHEEECPYFHEEDKLHPEKFYQDGLEDYWGNEYN